MTLSRTIHALIANWHRSIAGVLVSMVFAALAFSHVPPQYISTSTAVLVQPKVPGPTSANPLLTFDASLNTTAMILVQALNSPDIATQLGLTPGRDSYTVKNAGSAAIGGGIEQPFISFSGESPDPQKSAEIVAGLVNLAQQDLADRQNALHVLKSKAIMLQTVVGVTAPKPVRLVGLATAGAVVLLGIVMTVLAVCVCARRTTRGIRPDDGEFDPHSGDPLRQPVIAAWPPPVIATATTSTNNGGQGTSRD